YFWNTCELLHTASKTWEITQLGNCGSPIKTSKGWLLPIHGVGPVRKYVISAILLDLNNPEIVLATLDKPLISPNANEREGYVPNVVYTCGILQHAGNLIIPYAMSDSACSFATVNINTLLNELLKK
ncbi:MAG: glycosidase, partial [Bacteroidales bacterium]|nr:glycosidase [Bacteroidales bacterium]